MLCNAEACEVECLEDVTALPPWASGALQEV